MTASLKRLARDDGSATWHLGARLRNAFLTGLLIVGPVTITLYIMWWLINWVDAWVKPLLPTHYNPDTYLPFPLPGLGLIVAIIGLTIIGGLAANLLGRSLVSTGELMLGRCQSCATSTRRSSRFSKASSRPPGRSRAFRKSA